MARFSVRVDRPFVCNDRAEFESICYAFIRTDGGKFLDSE